MQQKEQQAVDQDTFDGAVKTNIEDFDMTAKEAIESAIQEFKIQGLDTSKLQLDDPCTRNQQSSMKRIISELEKKSQGSLSILERASILGLSVSETSQAQKSEANFVLECKKTQALTYILKFLNILAQELIALKQVSFEQYTITAYSPSILQLFYNILELLKKMIQMSVQFKSQNLICEFLAQTMCLYGLKYNNEQLQLVDGVEYQTKSTAVNGSLNSNIQDNVCNSNVKDNNDVADNNCQNSRSTENSCTQDVCQNTKSHNQNTTTRHQYYKQDNGIDTNNEQSLILDKRAKFRIQQNIQYKIINSCFTLAYLSCIQCDTNKGKLADLEFGQLSIKYINLYINSQSVLETSTSSTSKEYILREEIVLNCCKLLKSLTTNDDLLSPISRAGVTARDLVKYGIIQVLKRLLEHEAQHNITPAKYFKNQIAILQNNNTYKNYTTEGQNFQENKIKDLMQQKSSVGKEHSQSYKEVITTQKYRIQLYVQCLKQFCQHQELCKVVVNENIVPLLLQLQDQITNNFEGQQSASQSQTTEIYKQDHREGQKEALVSILDCLNQMGFSDEVKKLLVEQNGIARSLRVIKVFLNMSSQVLEAGLKLLQNITLRHPEHAQEFNYLGGVELLQKLIEDSICIQNTRIIRNAAQLLRNVIVRNNEVKQNALDYNFKDLLTQTLALKDSKYYKEAVLAAIRDLGF